MPSKNHQSELPLEDELNPAAVNTAPAAADSEAKPGDLSFEAAVERLSHIVTQLESDNLPLEQSLKLFEEGIRLARKSQARLESAERKVQELLNFDERGNPIVEELDQE